MSEKIKRVYIDTSVVLGNFDEDESRRRETDVFWNAVRNGEIVVVVSDVLDAELIKSRELVRKFFNELPESQIEEVSATIEVRNLAEQYISANVVSELRRNDCVHVAIATIYADGIVSWNSHDIVKRHEKYNSVNVAQGYPEIQIVTPNQYKEIYNEKQNGST